MQRAPPARDERLGPAVPAQQRREISIAPGTIWLVTAIVVALAVVAYVLARALTIILLLFIAIIFGEAIRPAMCWLHRRHVPRPVAVLLIYLAIVAFLALLAFLLLRPLIAQIGALQRDVPRYARDVQAFIGRIQRVISGNPQLANALRQAEGAAAGMLTGLLQYLLYIPLGVAAALASIVAIVAMAFFWLTGTDALGPFVIGLFPAEGRAHAAAVFREMGERLGGYVHGVVINMFVIGILSGVGDWLIGVPYPVLLGIFAGLMEVLPYVGPWFSGGVAVLVALVAGGLPLAVAVVVFYVGLQVLEGHTLVPVVMNRTVMLSPLTVIVAVLIGGTLLGLVGGVLAVPVAALLQVLVARVLAPAAHAAHRGRGTGGPARGPESGGGESAAPAPIA